MRCWSGHLHKVQIVCMWSSWCHCTPSSLASFKSRLVLPFWYWLTQAVLEKRLLNGCRVVVLVVTNTAVAQNTHTHLMALCPWLPGLAGIRKIKPIWILLKQETVSGSGISWAICNSASRSRQITTPAPHQLFYRPDALPVAQSTASKHWRQSKHWRHITHNRVKTDR